MHKSLLCVLSALCLATAVPLNAFAAADVTIEEVKYSSSANGTGSLGGTWDWDGQNTLALDNFASDKGIGVTGPITIVLSGDNEAASLTSVTDASASEGLDAIEALTTYPGAGDITLSGSGSFTTSEISTEPGDLVIEGVDVSVEYNKATAENELPAAISTGDLVVDSATLNVTATQNDASQNKESLDGIHAGSVTFKDSTIDVAVEAKEGTKASGIQAIGITPLNDGIPHDKGTIAINHSDVSVSLTPDGNALIAWGQWMPDGAGISDGSIEIVNSEIETPGMYVTTIDDYYGVSVQLISPEQGTQKTSSTTDFNPVPSSGVAIKKAATVVAPALSTNAERGLQAAHTAAMSGVTYAVEAQGNAEAATTPKTADNERFAGAIGLMVVSSALMAVSLFMMRRKRAAICGQHAALHTGGVR